MTARTHSIVGLLAVAALIGCTSEIEIPDDAHLTIEAKGGVDFTHRVGEPADPVEVARPYTLGYRGPEGAHEVPLSADELSSMMDFQATILADGVLSRDPTVVFDAADLRILLTDGEELHLARAGDSLRGPDPADPARPAHTVRWSPDYSLLTFETVDGLHQISLEGDLSAGDRQRWAATVAIDGLGGHGRTGSGPQPVAAAAVVVVALGIIAAASYVACVALGPGVCGDQAEKGCGAGKVDESKAICGAGFDVNGDFQLGFQCSYRCK